MDFKKHLSDNSVLFSLMNALQSKENFEDIKWISIVVNYRAEAHFNNCCTKQKAILGACTCIMLKMDLKTSLSVCLNVV